MLLDKLVFVSYLTVSGTNQEAYVSHPAWPAGLRMNIQPAGPSLTQLSEGQLFKTYKAFTTVSGVIEAYRVTVSGTSEVYTVRGRERYDYGSGQHYELILEKAGR